MKKFSLLIALMLLTANGSRAVSSRTTEVVRRDCQTTVARQELTFFANGTLRLRTRLNDDAQLRLAELNPEEVEAFVNRLLDEDLSEVAKGRAEVLGDLVERCEIHLRLAEQEPRQFNFGRFDSLSLPLARLNGIVDDMVQVVDDRSTTAGLPRSYVPRAGDVLERADGAQFEVIAYTSDGRGVELSGVDQPLTLFMAVEAVSGEFVSIVKRRRWP